MPRRVSRDPRPATRRRGGGSAEPRSIEEIQEGLRGAARKEGRFMVKPSRSEAKRYRCPWCEGWIEAGVLHVVSYEEGDPESRRHYHQGCWNKKRKN